MKVTVDQDTCINCAVCSTECPEVFEENEETGVTQIVEAYRVDGNPTFGEVPDDLADCVRAAAEACPVESIQIEE